MEFLRRFSLFIFSRRPVYLWPKAENKNKIPAAKNKGRKRRKNLKQPRNKIIKTKHSRLQHQIFNLEEEVLFFPHCIFLLHFIFHY